MGLIYAFTVAMGLLLGIGNSSQGAQKPNNNGEANGVNLGTP